MCTFGGREAEQIIEQTKSREKKATTNKALSKNAERKKERKKNNKTEKQISDKIGKLLTFPINVGSFIIKRERYERRLLFLFHSLHFVRSFAFGW